MNPEKERFNKVREIIPWGTQTNGKRPDRALEPETPYFFEEAEGCRLRATDGKWYIDYRSSLGPIILGYKYPAVDDAVRKQMEKGVVFSLASPIEYEVAEILVSELPGVDQVRFLKSGNEVNHAAIRLARAYTGRDKIVTCGYHGHGDWFSCGTGAETGWGFPRQGNGVPEALDHLVTRLTYGDIDAAEELFASQGNRIAALIMVPYDWGEKVAGDFVKRMRELTSTYGTVLIFDQVLTGFRLARKGAQEYFGVVPDVSTYAKAIANGYPLAAFAGKSEIMEMLDRVLITTTHAGEALSLAAGKATLQTIFSEPVVEHIWKMGRRLMTGFDELAHNVGLTARSTGLPPSPRFRFSPGQDANQSANTLFYRELLKRGIFPSANFLINYAHKEADIDQTLEAMGEALEVLAGAAAVWVE